MYNQWAPTVIISSVSSNQNSFAWRVPPFFKHWGQEGGEVGAEVAGQVQHPRIALREQFE